MRRPLSRTVIVFVATLAGLTAACGGSSSTVTDPPAEATAGTETEAPAQVGDSETADACALLTADEVADATGQPGIEAQPVAEGDTDALSACGFVSNGVTPVVITTILDPANTNTDASSYLALPGSVEVPVNGARAIFMPAAGYVMAVVKGSTVVTFQVAMPATGEDVQATATKLVQKVADRM